MSNEVNEEFVYNLSKMLNVPVSEVVQKLGYVEMVGNPFWKSEEDRKSASPEPAAPAAPKGGDQRLSPEPKAAAAPAPTRMPVGGAPDRSTPNPMITEGDRELGGMGANAASGSAGVQGQRDGSWRGQTPEINLPGRVADNQYANQAGDGSFAGAARGVGGPPELRNVESDYDAGYGAQGVADFTQQIRDKAPRPQPQVTRGRPSTPIIPTSPSETTDSPPEMMGPPSNGEEARVEGVPYSDETGQAPNWRGNTNISGPGTNGRGLPPPPSGSLRNISPEEARDAETGVLYSRKDFDAINGRRSLMSYGSGGTYVPTGADSNPLAQARPTPTPTGKSYSAIFNNNDPEAMLKKLAEITGVRQDEIVKKLGNANFSENPFFDKDPRY